MWGSGVGPRTSDIGMLCSRRSAVSTPMLSGYLPVAIFLGLILAFAAGSLAAAWIVRPSRPSASKSENYECGAQPIGEAWVQFPVGFYLVALIFLVFDTLAVFLFPWAVTMRALGLHGLLVMLGFVAILALAWIYAYREGLLEWK
jgi:NADH-quinone oxidoreductase subunit A